MMIVIMAVMRTSATIGVLNTIKAAPMATVPGEPMGAEEAGKLTAKDLRVKVTMRDTAAQAPMACPAETMAQLLVAMKVAIMG